MRVSVLHSHQIVFIVDGRGRRKRQRRRLHAAVQRPPDIDDAVTHTLADDALCLGWITDVQPDAVLRRFAGLVDVCSVNGLARGGGILFTDGVVEDDDALGAGDVLLQQLLHFGVVEALDFGVGVEGGVSCCCGDVLEDLEGVCVEGVVCFVAADVD